MTDYYHFINETLCTWCNRSIDWTSSYCSHCENDSYDCESYCLICENYICEPYDDASDMYCDKYINAATTIQIKYKYYKLKKIKYILSKVTLKDCIENIISYYDYKG